MCRPRQDAELREAMNAIVEREHTFMGESNAVHVRDIAAELGVNSNGLRERLNRANGIEQVKGFDPRRGKPCIGWAIKQRVTA